MNFIEAIKSGKRFFRPCKSSMVAADYKVRIHRGEDSFQVTESDLLADDWQLEEQKIELTRNQVNEAFRLGAVSAHAMQAHEEFSKYMKELGFD